MNFSFTSIVAIVIAIIIIRIITKVLGRLIGLVFLVLATVVVMYYYNWGPFKDHTADVTVLVDRYCQGEEQDEDVCDCVIRLAQADMEYRFTPSELDSIRNNKWMSVHVLTKSMDATRSEAMECLATREAEHKYDSMVSLLIPQRSEYIEEVKEGFRSLQNRILEEYNDFQDSRDGVNDRY